MSDAVQKFLSSYRPEVRDLALKARELVRSIIPDAQEKVYSGWKLILYSLDGSMKGAMCAIGPHKAHVSLGFYRGVDLDDPVGLLEGTGKNLRHVKLKRPEDVQAQSLKSLIKSAAALTREDRNRR
jgi:hypothetical protein